MVSLLKVPTWVTTLPVMTPRCLSSRATLTALGSKSASITCTTQCSGHQN